MQGEALPPLSLAGADTSVVMAGTRSRPSTFSKVESVHGLHVSIMERLATLPAYQATPRRGRARLTLNYRSHPALVNLLEDLVLEHAGARGAEGESRGARGVVEARVDADAPAALLRCGGRRGGARGDSPSSTGRRRVASAT